MLVLFRKTVLKKVFHIFINKYFIVTLAFLVWMGFFDTDNYITRRKLNDKLNNLRKEKQYYLNEIKNDSILTVKLQTDSLALEKLAREKYQMKKDKEDVFLVFDTTVDRHPQ
jgi:cell division protein DivIC